MRKTFKMFSALMLFLTIGANSNEFSATFDEPEKRPFLTKKDHPDIQGFTYANGIEEKQKVASAYGYFYLDTDYYYAQFTDVSRLYLIRVRVNFTPGSVASKNGESGFDHHYDLWSGFIHVQPFSRTENSFKKSSSYSYIKSWPLSNSDSLSCSVTSSFSSNYSISSDIEAGVKLPEGASITRKTGNGLTIGLSTSTSIYGPEPSISHQESPSNSNMAQWDYQFKSPLTSSYEMSCCFLMEVKNDSIAYQSYSFGYQIDTKMTNTAWEAFPWRQHKETVSTSSYVCGL